jgi:hypothetical protein
LPRRAVQVPGGVWISAPVRVGWQNNGRPFGGRPSFGRKPEISIKQAVELAIQCECLRPPQKWEDGRRIMGNHNPALPKNL